MASGPNGLGALQAASLSTATEQYRHNSGWVYVAIRAIAQRIAGQDLHVGQIPTRPKRRGKAIGDKVEPIDDHPLLDSINEPNAIQTRWQLMVSTIAGLELTGKAYWWLPDSDNGKVDVWPLPATWVEPSDSLRGSYTVRPSGSVEGFPVPAEHIAPFTLPDPSNPFGSLSPLQTQAPAVATDEAIQSAQHRAFQNGIHPGVILRAGRLPSQIPGSPGEVPSLNDDQRRDSIQAIKTTYKDVANHGEPLILDALIESVEKFSHTPEEMDFLDSGKSTKGRILQAYGVNPLILGEIEGANRAQAVVAEESFCSNTVNPLIEMMSQAITRWVCPRFAADVAVLFQRVPCTRGDEPSPALDSPEHRECSLRWRSFDGHSKCLI